MTYIASKNIDGDFKPLFDTAVKCIADNKMNFHMCGEQLGTLLSSQANPDRFREVEKAKKPTVAVGSP